MKNQTVTDNITKGKWEVDEIDHDTVIGCIEEEASAKTICKLNKMLPKKELESNLKLITSAPEMLRVLKAVNKYNWDCNQGRLDDHHKKTMRFEWIWDRVQGVLENLDEYETYPLEEEVA